MSTQIILTADVENLGLAGETVTVSDGYARNFLLPRGVGLPASAANLKRFEGLRKKRAAEAEEALQTARDLETKLTKQSYTITAAVGADDKLYGSVTANDIADALQKEGLAVDRKQIHLDNPIRSAGVFDVDVKLHPEVSTKVKIWIVSGEGDTPAADQPQAE